MLPQAPPAPNVQARTKFWYIALVIICGLFLVRLFYLQVIQHGHYKSAALQGQFKEYEIPPTRGIIEAHNGDSIVPIVLNEPKYTVFADPVYVEDVAKASQQVQQIIGGNASDYEAAMREETRYAVLAKKLSKEQAAQIDALELKGIGTRAIQYRTYPQGSLAAHILGFVNDEGVGTYGLEQALNEQLKGKPGQLKAITDAKGVPLVANEDNVMTEPEEGQRVVLTVDIGMQRQLEDILKKGLARAQAKSGSALIMEANTGAIKAMASYPTYNPGEFFKQKDARVFNNTNVTDPLEVGSVMKPLTVAAALDQGAVTKNTSYFDPGFFKVDDATVSNVEEVAGSGTRRVPDILEQSLNTGATWLLMQMGGGTINEQARTRWHDYMVNRYRFGKQTGIEQGFESNGTVPDPKEGYGLNITFANTAFGQGMLTTPIQMAAADAAVINGGTYYRPRLVDKYIDADGNETTVQPDILSDNVVKDSVSHDVRVMMEGVVTRNYRAYSFTSLRPNYSIGGKSGTAQIANPAGGYYADKFDGTFTGFVGGDRPHYVIVVRTDEPKVPGYAGSRAAGPIFADLTNMLLDNFNVLPKTK